MTEPKPTYTDHNASHWNQMPEPTVTKTTDTWTDGEYTYRELNQQPYADCIFSVGQVLDHPVDELYLRWERNNDWGTLLLRPDEVAAINYLLASLLWSDLVYQAEDSDALPALTQLPHEATRQPHGGH